MTPAQKLKHLILLKHADLGDEPMTVEVTAENIDQLFEDAEGEGYELQDATSEVRGGSVETGIKPAEWSRHYECKSVAAKVPDGSWVGWTYWYGGGKHGEPESVEWIDDAYAVNLSEEEKLVVVSTFTRATEAR